MATPPVSGTIRGVMATDGTLAVNPDQKKIDMQDRIFLYDPEANPLLTIVTQQTSKETATEVEGKWLEDSPVPEWLNLQSAATNVATTLAMATGTGAYIVAPTILRNVVTGEAIYVASMAGDNATVTRGWGGTTAAAIATTDGLLNLRNAQPQGASSAPEALATLKATKSNFCEIVTHSVKISKTGDAVAMYGKDGERVYQRAKQTVEHARAWEQLLLHGQKGSNTAVATPTFTTGGIDNYVTSNVLTANGPLSESNWMSYLYSVFRYSVNPGRKQKALYASAEMINTINSWGTAKLQTTPNADKASERYGIDIREYVSGFGRLSVMLHPLLENGYAGRAYVVDHDGVAVRYLRPTAMSTNVQPPDADYFLDKILTEAMFRVTNDLAHGIVKGVTF